MTTIRSCIAALLGVLAGAGLAGLAFAVPYVWTGASLIAGAVGPGAIRTTARDIETQIQRNVAAAEVDNDGDGWMVSQGDCCDVATATCTEPALVNPGAFEVLGNGVDDDCDVVIDNPRAVCDGALPSNASDPFMYAQAMDLCQTTTEIPPIDQRRWGLINSQLLLSDGTGSPAAASRSIRQNFSSENNPQFGQSLSVLSTGHAAAVGQANPSYAAFQGGQVMATQSAFPNDWLSANGNTLPVGSPGCPAGVGSLAQDPVMLKLRIRVPTNARSFNLSTRFFAAEYPEWVCSVFDDYYLVLLDSTFAGSPPNPTDKNIAVYPAPGGGRHLIGTGLAFANTGLFQACKNGPTGCASGAIAGTTTTCTGTGDLTGTGFDVANPPSQFMTDPGYCGPNNLLGGGTAWLTTSGNVVPGETIELRFVIWDTSDGYYDSVALLDNFQWSVQPTTPGTFIVGQVPQPAPGAFNKSSPANGATSQPTSLTLSWGASSNATSYEYCYDTTNDNACSGWTSTGTALSVGLSGLSANTAYYWHVRANNGSGTTYANGSNTAYWSFTTQVTAVSVTVTTNPAGRSITVDGALSTAPQTFSWTVGSNHTIATSSPQTSGETRYVYTSWSDSGALSHTVTTPASATTYTANFGTEFLLTTAVSPPGAGSIAANPTSADGFYASGAMVQLTATPNGGYTFGNWTGDLTGTANPQSVTMSAARVVTAFFDSPTVPGTPTGVTGTGGNAQVALSWTAPASNGGSAITGYQVQVATSAGGTYANATGCPTNSTTPSCTATGLTNGTTYFFKVAAINAVGTGAYSAASSGVTPSAPAFTDTPLVAGVTPIKAIHITELRSRINALRALHPPLGPYPYVETITSTTTTIKAQHILELRQALLEVYQQIPQTPPTYTTTPTLGGTVVVADVQSLRAAVLAIE